MVKGFVKAGMVCVGLAGSLHAVAADMEWYYRNFAPIDLATLKGCGKAEMYDGYLASVKQGLEIAPEIDHTRVSVFMKNLIDKADMEYQLMGYKTYDDYEASGKPGPNPSAAVREGCDARVSDALKNRIKINELSMKTLRAR
ncbi:MULTISPECIES: hypothetical protein [Pseudomonas syringae group]|uniref:hypothetical protein n=1 Tax=Pseudomonas syringae group TaxID=136849 RepID=UPI0004659A0E|nr:MULTISPECIES: hypothetical protein [Pseudomonas syringae group]RMN05152.1 hypothetical protein ALQ68_03405 [Pseudomonas savastanoi pv. glycinea]RMP99824.1 hypothetical protein ALQ13_04043 [Pseudomonas savastanoi pv. glycinea]RMQ83771.1 hypothetical protein ALP96_03979 [Pseudomonas savastanoi pv. glycinea]